MVFWIRCIAGTYYLPSYTMCRTGAEAQPSSAAHKRLLWFRGVGGIHVCPRSSCAMLPGCAWTEGPFSDITSRTLQRIKRKRGPNRRHHKSRGILKRWPGLGPPPALPTKPERTLQKKKQERPFTYLTTHDSNTTLTFWCQLVHNIWSAHRRRNQIC